MSELTIQLKDIDVPQFIEQCTRDLQTYLEGSGSEGYLVCVSGDLNSAVTALLCGRAVGGDRVHALYLFERQGHSQRAVKTINRVARMGRINLSMVEITHLHRNLLQELPLIEKEERKVSDERSAEIERNLLERLKMAILYYYSNRYDFLVCGTKNKSQIKLGLMTKWGDGSADIMPLGDLFTTQVDMVARTLHIGFLAHRSGQDEREEDLGLDLALEEIDPILHGLERGWTAEEIAEATDFRPGLVNQVRNRWEQKKHKSSPVKLPLDG